MTRCYALRDDRWERIGELLPGPEDVVGVTAKDNRLFVDAVLYRYRPGFFGATCQDASASGKRSTPEASDRWWAEKVVLRRSARRLMEGWVPVPDSALVPPENRSNRVQLVGYFLLNLRSLYQPPVFTGSALSVIIPTRRVIHSFCG